MAISFQRDIAQFVSIVERERDGEKIVTNAITIIFNLYTSACLWRCWGKLASARKKISDRIVDPVNLEL